MARRIINERLRDEISRAEGGEVEKQILKELLELEIASENLDIDDYKKLVSKHIK
jgi:hypothetical protein